MSIYKVCVRFFTVSLLLPAICVCSFGATPDSHYIYKKSADRELRIDLIYPDDWREGDARPAIIFFYNGGWKKASANLQFEPQAKYFASRGAIVARADYREKDSSGVTSEKCMEDIFSAVRWMRKNAGILGIDPERIAAGGGSGSGHLAASVFYVNELRAPQDDPSISPRLRALLLFNPDLSVLDPAIMDRMLKDDKAHAGLMPPTLMLYGDQDASHFLIVDFVNRARDLGMPVQSFVGQGATHGFFKFSPWLEKTTQRADEFLQSAGLLKSEPRADLPSKLKPENYDKKVKENMVKWQAHYEAQTKSRQEKSDFPKIPNAVGSGENTGGITRKGGLKMGEPQGFKNAQMYSNNAKSKTPKALKETIPAESEIDPSVSSDTVISETRVYKNIGERKLILMIHYPPDWKSDDRRPAMVIFHGGVFNPRNKAGELYPMAEERKRLGLPVPESKLNQAFQAYAEYFARRGMVALRVDSRSRSKDGVMPGKCIEDALSAMRWVRKNATALGIDPDRIVSAGGSSGGCMAASVATIDEFQSLEDDRSISPRPNAMLLHYPLLDWLPEESTSSGSFLDALNGDREYAMRISPGRHWSKDIPPTLVFIGTKDPMFESLSKFVAHWKEQGANIDIYIGEGGNHGFSQFSPWLEKTTERSDEFLRAVDYLQNEPRVELPHRDKAEKLNRKKPAQNDPEASDTNKEPTPPERYIYKSFGERILQMAAHYPSDWKKDDTRPAALLFSGAHKVKADASGNLPPLAAERAKLGLPVVNAGSAGPGAFHVPLADHFARQGLVCFRVEYRTRGKDGVLPGEDVVDAVDAIRWVRRNAAILGIDPNRIVAAGCSSGGYLAAGLFSLDHLHPENEESSVPVSARPNALLLFSPLLDWLRVGSMSENFMVVLGGDKELGARISPARYWRRDMPPTLILVGTEEPMFDVVKEFADKWMAEDTPMELFVAEGGVHGFFGKPEWVELANARADEFLRGLGYLKDEPRMESAARSEKIESGKTGAKASKKATEMTGKLSAMLEKYPEADVNKDGVLTMEEARTHRNKKRQSPKKQEAQTATDNGKASTDTASHPLLVPSRDWDINQDGKISKDEFKAPAMMFEKLDTNGDGFLSGDEFVKLDSKFNLDKTGDVNWVVPPEQNYHGVEHKTYFSEAMQTDVGYNIYLPDEYATTQKRYPVIYHLHGSGGNESAQIDLSPVYQKAIEERRMCPVIIVFVNGGRRSYYCDGANGKVMAETTIIRELIPHIDATYRTIPEKACRVIHGFSMGGFGALRLGAKYPDLFCAVLSFAGGMAKPDSIHMLFLTHILGYDDRLFAENNPADLVIKNKNAFSGMSFWLFTGTKDVALEDSTWAHEFLKSQNIPHRFEVSEDVRHALKKHYTLFGDEIFQMLQTHFAASETFSK